MASTIDSGRSICFGFCSVSTVAELIIRKNTSTVNTSISGVRFSREVNRLFRAMRRIRREFLMARLRWKSP